MRRATRRWLSSWLLALMAWSCSAGRAADPDIVRPAYGAPFLEKLPGPMLGPFDSYSDALLAACRRIFSKPNASAGRRDHPEFTTRWRVSSEYCAWLYYTPDQHYVVSKLTDQSRVDPLQRSKNCLLPSEVDDPRYPAGSIKYIYALHNHPYGSALSDDDIRFIVAEGATRGFESETKDGRLRLSIVAFFSSGTEEPSCDGFHQYIPLTGQLLKWTSLQGGWRCERTGFVVWHEGSELDFSITQSQGPCTRGDSP